MSERLRSRDLAFLTAEGPTTPMHNATVQVFAPGDSGFDHDRLVELIGDRIGFAPRYRQRVQMVPGSLANPVWVDDSRFDIGYHVRRSALPRPGTFEQLRELVGRIVSRPLDRSRPLWEIYFVEGLVDGHVALLYKSHQALVDGIDTVDLGQVLLDAAPERKELGGDAWLPAPHPSAATLVTSAVHETVTDPRVAIDTVRSLSSSLLRGADELADLLRVPLPGRGQDHSTPISGPLSQQRQVIAVRTELATYRRIREAHGGSVNDVILATIAGGLRGWLMTRAESLGGLRSIRAVVPVSVIDKDLEVEATSLGSQIAPHYVDLPIGEPSALVRLHQVSYSFKAHREAGRGVAADRLASVAGFAPTTFHAIGSRVAATELRRGFQLCVVNVPGPQSPMYAAGARMIGSYPVPPLLPDHALAIGATSYDGSVFYGITVDRDRIPDFEVLAQCLREALDELLDTTSAPPAARGRRRRAPQKENEK